MAQPAAHDACAGRVLVESLRWHLQRDGVEAHDDAQLEQIVVAQRERAKTIKEMAANSLFFFRAPVVYDEKAVRKHVGAEVVGLLAVVAQELEAVVAWNAPAIHAVISGVATRAGLALGKLAQPIRLAMCGGTVSPPIDATLAILGKHEVLTRLARTQALWSVV